MSETCIIPLGRNGQYETIVSQCDYAALTKWRWNFKLSSWKYGHNTYARRGGGKDTKNGGNKATILMHVFILETLMGVPRPTELHTVNHIDRNTLNNQRDNLEWESPSGQNRNHARSAVKAKAIAAEELAA
jgi:hypothetical protein